VDRWAYKKKWEGAWIMGLSFRSHRPLGSEGNEHTCQEAQRTRTPEKSFLAPVIYAASTQGRGLKWVPEPVTIVTPMLP
jgi:hypothetical protein